MVGIKICDRVVEVLNIIAIHNQKAAIITERRTFILAA